MREPSTASKYIPMQLNTRQNRDSSGMEKEELQNEEMKREEKEIEEIEKEQARNCREREGRAGK